MMKSHNPLKFLLSALVLPVIAGSVLVLSQVTTYAAESYEDGDTYTDTATGAVYAYSETLSGFIFQDTTDDLASLTIPASLTVDSTDYTVYITRDSALAFTHDVNTLTIGCQYSDEVYFTYSTYIGRYGADYYGYYDNIHPLWESTDFLNNGTGTYENLIINVTWELDNYDVLSFPAESLETLTFKKAADYTLLLYNSNLVYTPSLRSVTFNKKFTGEFLTVPESLKEIHLLGGASDFPRVYNNSHLTTLEISSCDNTTLSEYYINGDSALKNLTLPSNLKAINTYALDGCTALTSIKIPASVTQIGNSVFSGLSKLKKVTFTSKSKLSSIGNNAFYGCTSLASIEIPASVTSLGSSVFQNCTKLKEVTFTSKSKLSSISSNAFYGCTSLASIEIPISVTSLGYSTFQNCTKLKEVTFAGAKLKTIEDNTFNGCSSLTSIQIPNSVTSIGYEAFYNCSKLKKVTFTDNSKLKSINSHAFGYCTSLVSFTIPSKVTALWSYIFIGDTGLYQLIFKGSPTDLDNSALYIDDTTEKQITLVSPSGSDIEEQAINRGYKTTTTSKLTFSTVPSEFYVGESDGQITVYNNTAKITYKSSKKSVVQVKSDGTLTIKKLGTAKITVKTGSTSKVYTIKVIKRTMKNVLDHIYKYYVTADMSDYEKIVAADAWLAANTVYDYTALSASESSSRFQHAHSVEGSFLYGTCVCEGYAKAFQKIMDHYGIPCLLICNFEHAWNEVKLASKWYFVDATWDDPGYDSEQVVSTQEYLLKTTSYMESDHYSKSYWYVGTDAGVGVWPDYNKTIPTANSTTYNTQVNHTGYNGAVINKTSISLKKGKTSTIKVSGTSEKVTFSSSNKKIATVTGKGVVKGIKKGSTTIKVKIGSKTFSVAVTVK